MPAILIDRSKSSRMRSFGLFREAVPVEEVIEDVEVVVVVKDSTVEVYTDKEAQDYLSNK